VADFEVCREGRRRFGRNLASYIRWTMFCCADAGRFDECETRDQLYNVFVHFSVSPGLRTKTSNHANLSHGDISMVQCCPEMCQRYHDGKDRLGRKETGIDVILCRGRRNVNDSNVCKNSTRLLDPVFGLPSLVPSCFILLDDPASPGLLELSDTATHLLVYNLVITCEAQQGRSCCQVLVSGAATWHLSCVDEW